LDNKIARNNEKTAKEEKAILEKVKELFDKN